MAATVLSGGFAFAADDQGPPSVGAYAGYRVVHGWPQLPEGRVLGSVSGVGIDTRGDVFVFHRADRTWPPSGELATTPIVGPTVTVFDARTGKVLAEWGENTFAMPHGLTVDRDDNVWLTDVALHQVYKFTHDGKLLLTLGERGVSGNDATQLDGTMIERFGRWGNYDGQFRMAHDVAVAQDGAVYVGDITGSRVQKFVAGE